MQHEQCVAKLNTAKSKVTALQKQLKNTEKRIAIAGKKLALDLVVAKSEMNSATKFHEVAKINFERLKPALKSGAITESEFEVVRQELLVAEADKMTAQNAAIACYQKARLIAWSMCWSLGARSTLITTGRKCQTQRIDTMTRRYAISTLGLAVRLKTVRQVCRIWLMQFAA